MAALYELIMDPPRRGSNRRINRLHVVAALRACLTATAALLLIHSAASATNPMKNSPTSNKGALIVIGASYAASWGAPVLGGYQVTNRGVAGEETTQIRQRFAQDVVAARPEAALIWGHINDIHRAPAGKIEEVKRRAKQNYTQMVAEARRAGIEVILATEITLPVPDTWKEKIMALAARVRRKQDYRRLVNGHVKELNAWLREFAKNEELRLLDFERAVDSGNGTRKIEYAQEDGSHITPAGYAALTAFANRELSQRS